MEPRVGLVGLSQSVFNRLADVGDLLLKRPEAFLSFRVAAARLRVQALDLCVYLFDEILLNHLGKVPTYLAAFEAPVAVWIVETPRPEHVPAFAWLNDASNASFFLAQVQAVRIGDSLPAPLLTLLVEPGEARTRVSDIKKEMAESDRLSLQFWSELSHAPRGEPFRRRPWLTMS